MSESLHSQCNCDTFNIPKVSFQQWSANVTQWNNSNYIKQHFRFAIGHKIMKINLQQLSGYGVSFYTLGCYLAWQFYTNEYNIWYMFITIVSIVGMISDPI